MRLAVHKISARSAGKVHVHKSTTREVERGWIRRGGKTVEFFAAIDSGGGSPGVAVDPSLVTGVISSSSAKPVRSSTAYVTVSAGVPPYSYAWSHTSGDAMTATFPTSASTEFTASVAPGGDIAAVFTCTVTDSAGFSGSVSVNAALQNIGGTL